MVNVDDYVISGKSVLAYGYANSAITGKPQVLMMVKLDNVGDQYPELAIPLHSEAAPSHNLAIIDKGELEALRADAADLKFVRENCDHEWDYVDNASGDEFYAGGLRYEECAICKKTQELQPYDYDPQDGSDNTM